VVVLVSLILLELTEDKGGGNPKTVIKPANSWACSKASGIMMSVIIARIAAAHSGGRSDNFYREVTEEA